MRLTQYINETKEIDPDDIDILIEKDCNPWLKESKGIPVYRGAKNKPYAYRGTVLTDRKPRDTDIQIQKTFDNVIQKKYGFKPRSSGLFVTGGLFQCQRYGRVYEIFPIGKFKFLWSATIRDFYAEVGRWNSSYRVTLLDAGVDTKELTKELVYKRPDFHELVGNHIEREYTDKKIMAAIRSEKEIMIVCKEYYAKAIM